MTPIILITMLAMAEAAAETVAPVMPGIPALIATTVIATQFIKKGINSIKIGFLERLIVEKSGAVVLAVLVSAGTVAYYALATKTPFDFELLKLAGSVALASPIIKALIPK